MNMISTGAFLNEMDASNKQPTVAEKFAAVWEKKNAKAARAGGVSLMALSLAACGSSSTTTTTTTDTTTDTTPVTPATPASQAFTLTAGADTFTGGDGDDTFTAATAAVAQGFDTLTGGAGTDTLTVTDITAAYAGATGVGASATGIENLTVSTSGGMGTVAVAASGGQAAQAAQAQVMTITPLATGTFTNTDTLTITIGDATYTTVVDSTTSGKVKAGAAIKAVLDAHLGDDQNAGTSGYSAAVDTDAHGTTGVVTVTSHFAGVAIPTITVTSSTAADTVTVADSTANKVAYGPGAIKEVRTLTFADGGTTNAAADVEAGSAITVSINGVDYVGAAGNSGAHASATASTPTEIAKDVAAIINSALGAGSAVAGGPTVTVTAPTAGTSLGMINVKVASASEMTNTQVVSVANQGAVVADSGAVTEKVFDVSGYAGDVVLTAAGDSVVKAAATANVTLNNSSGAVDVSGGKDVTIVTSGTGTTGIDGAALSNVSIKGGGNVTVDNTGGTLGTTTSTGTTMTAVSLNAISGTTAAIKGAAVTDIDLTGQKSALAVTVTNGTSTTLDLDLDGVGYNSAGTGVTVSVAAGAKAKTIAVDTASKSNVTITEPGTVVETLTFSGAGDLTADISGVTASTLTSTASGKLTLGSLNAATKSVSTQSGADTITVAATDKNVSVSTGGGDDVITVGALAAGATVSLGAGNDDLKASGSALAAKTTALPQTIDGGDGNDMISSALINAGNASRVVNFETLGMAASSGTVDTSILTGITGLEMLAQGATYSKVAVGTSLAIDANIGTSSNTLSFSSATGKTDAFTINFGAKGATTSTAAAPTTIDGGTVVMAGIENITINSGQASGFVNNTIDLTAANAKTIVVTGDADTTTLAFASTTGTQTSATDEAVASIDTTGLTGDLSLNTTSVVGATSGFVVNTGSGKDGVTLAQKTTINSGEGVDTITFAVGSYNSTLTAGSEKDVLDIKALVHDSTDVAEDTGIEILVTLADANAGDTIDFSAGAEDAETLGTAVSLTATTLEGALDQIAAGSGTTHFAWGQYNGNTYVVHNSDKGSGTDTALENGDVVLALTGLIDLSDSTTDTGGILTIV